MRKFLKKSKKFLENLKKFWIFLKMLYTKSKKYKQAPQRRCPQCPPPHLGLGGTSPPVPYRTVRPCIRVWLNGLNRSVCTGTARGGGRWVRRSARAAVRAAFVCAVEPLEQQLHALQQLQQLLQTELHALPARTNATVHVRALDRHLYNLLV